MNLGRQFSVTYKQTVIVINKSLYEEGISTLVNVMLKLQLHKLHWLFQNICTHVPPPQNIYFTPTPTSSGNLKLSFKYFGFSDSLCLGISNDFQSIGGGGGGGEGETWFITGTAHL